MAHKCILLIIFLGVFRLVFAQNEGRDIKRNPFLTSGEEKGFVRKHAVDEEPELLTETTFVISGIIYSALEDKKVIINGRILKAGDIIGNMEIVDIEPERVIFKSGREKYFLELPKILKE